VSQWGPQGQTQNPWGAPSNPWGHPATIPGAQYTQAAYRPTAKSSSASRVLIAILLVPIVLFLLIMLIKIMSSISDTGQDTYNPPPPEPVPVTTSSPVSSPTSPVSSPSTPSTSPSSPQGGTFVNDTYQVPEPDLNPPELPMPQTYDEAATWLMSNVFYNQTIPVPVRCEIPAIDPATASKAQLQTYLNDAIACLMRVWAPELQASGYNAARPSVTIYSGQMQSPCGKLPSENAVYCSADQQVYYAKDLPALFPSSQHDPLVPVAVVAHEFGHALQAQSGILYSESAWQQHYENSGDTTTSHDLSRRTEMQADCFAGAFFQAVTQSVRITPQQLAAITGVFFAIGDDQLSGDPTIDGDHGLGANRKAWMNTGLTSTRIGACNTFADSVTDASVR